LLVSKNVKKVVICNGDPNPLVSGRGISILRAAGIEVVCDVLAEEGLKLNRRFFTSFIKKRPYIILKWAETADGFLAGKDGKPVKISGEFSGMHVHKWRSEEDAILIGYNTAMNDNPKLNVRHWEGRNPVRIVLDRNLQLPDSLNLFDNVQQTIVVNYNKETEPVSIPERYLQNFQTSFLKINPAENEKEEILFKLHKRGIQSILVEGGSKVLSSFLDSGLWDEIRRCQSIKTIGSGIKAPLPMGVLTGSEKVQDDLWSYYMHF
jgi:diaminohydroxyphosphoribosylaminopyrimidine deaminase/5-amino-6-(5-phosphoribosylamino)uracil reductase